MKAESGFFLGVFWKCKLDFCAKMLLLWRLLDQNHLKVKKKKKKKPKILGEKGIKKSSVISTQNGSRGLLALQASFVYIFQSKKTGEENSRDIKTNPNTFQNENNCHF